MLLRIEASNWQTHFHSLCGNLLNISPYNVGIYNKKRVGCAFVGAKAADGKSTHLLFGGAVVDINSDTFIVYSKYSLPGSVLNFKEGFPY